MLQVLEPVFGHLFPQLLGILRVELNQLLLNIGAVPEIDAANRNMEFQAPPPTVAERISVLSRSLNRLIGTIDVSRNLNEIKELLWDIPV